jgi:hypothetical protein
MFHGGSNLLADRGVPQAQGVVGGPTEDARRSLIRRAPNTAPGAMGNVENGVQTLSYGLGIIFMLGGAVAAYVRAPQTRIGKQERDLVEYKVYVAERYASKEYLSKTKREIFDSIRDLARRIEHP